MSDLQFTINGKSINATKFTGETRQFLTNFNTKRKNVSDVTIIDTPCKIHENALPARLN